MRLEGYTKRGKRMRLTVRPVRMLLWLASIVLLFLYVPFGIGLLIVLLTFAASSEWEFADK